MPSDGESHPQVSANDGNDNEHVGGAGDTSSATAGAVHLGATNGLTSNNGAASVRRRRTHKQFVPDVLKSSGAAHAGGMGSGPASFDAADADATFSGAGDYGATRDQLLIDDSSSNNDSNT